MPEVVEQSKITPHGIVIKKDKQEEEFEQFLKLWLDNKIDYVTLTNHLPAQYKSVWKRFLEYLASKST
jgi:hypothetical protein